jgi:hypothetical protein
MPGNYQMSRPFRSHHAHIDRTFFATRDAGCLKPTCSTRSEIGVRLQPRRFSFDTKLSAWPRESLKSNSRPLHNKLDKAIIVMSIRLDHSLLLLVSLSLLIVDSSAWTGSVDASTQCWEADLLTDEVGYGKSQSFHGLGDAQRTNSSVIQDFPAINFNKMKGLGFTPYEISVPR